MSRTEQLADTAVDSAEVAWLVSKRAAAIRSRDAEYLASRYTPDAVTFGVAPPLSPFGGEAQRVEWLRGWFERMRGRIDHRVQDLTVSVGGDAVTVTVSHPSATDVALIGHLVGDVTVQATSTMALEPP